MLENGIPFRNIMNSNRYHKVNTRLYPLVIIIVYFIQGGWIPHWRHASWMTPELKHKFRLHHSGKVTVTEPGIYYVYSQVRIEYSKININIRSII